MTEPFIAFAGDTKIKCPKCRNKQMKEGYDPCLGKIPGVTKACCGHGGEQPYLAFENGWTMQFWKDEKSLFLWNKNEGMVFFDDRIMYLKSRRYDQLKDGVNGLIFVDNEHVLCEVKK